MELCVVSDSADKTVQVRDLVARRPVATLGGHKYPVKDVSIAPNGSSIYSRDQSGEIRT
jgi:hypothetical protein